MTRISLTDFIDVVSKSGTPKATKVAQIKNRPEYGPAQDFYKIFRDGVVELHKQDGDKIDLKNILLKTADSKRLDHYPGMIKGYSKWWGKKTLAWFPPPTTTYSNLGIEISVNPELGLTIDDTNYIIKMYMKSEKLTKLRTEIITELMEKSLRPLIKNKAKVVVLDVKNSKPFEYVPGKKALKPMIDAELAYIASLWPSL
ncbi:hypothetical protein RDV84_09430 [Lysobacter yananisis]|uniref:Uncharacterized protein n=1 Tax=Lysobacter yananisis TaxID=1003114 RepID=A0ABY9PD94_9GAMM|nr:hypothetical protein [Lysobacter yananisis]WMT05045.1 hypothetical protein RDV84_09430 [Lysobacter yananisis]